MVVGRCLTWLTGITLGIQADYPDLDWTEPVEIVFVSLFALEFLCKLLAYGEKFFHDSFNVFEFGIVAISLVEIILKNTTEADTVGNLSLLRMLRIVRLVRVFTMMGHLQVLITSFVRAMKSVVW